MKKDNIKLNTYRISGDNTLLDKQNHITPEIRKILDGLHQDSLKGNKHLIKKLNTLCLKYPQVPVFKNLLSSVFQNDGEMDQAYSVNHWLVKEHPEYLFGKLNLAAELLINDEPEKIPGILGKVMDIGELYPNRKEFHVEEVMGFNNIAIQYFLSVNDVEQAEWRFEIMEDLDEDHHKTQYAREFLQEWYISKASEGLEEENLLKKTTLIKTSRGQQQTEKAPSFNFPEEISWLYQTDLGIDHGKIQQILELNAHKLTEDLEKMLRDSIVRFDHFSEKAQNEGFGSEELFFPIHALFFLSELRSESSLPRILQLLQQDSEFNELWFGEYVNEVFESALYHCGRNQTPLLFDFLRLPNIYDINKAIVGEALVKIIVDSNEEREVFVEQYRRVLEVYIENATDENYADSDATGFIISDITDLAYEELLPEIKQLFDMDLVGFWICGTFDEIEMIIKEQPYNLDLQFIKLDIFEKYNEFCRYEEEGFSDLEMEDLEMDDLEMEDLDLDDDFINRLYHEEMLKPTLLDHGSNEPIQNPKKTGRNDKCPCGSGKKYKKCCINE